MPAVFTLGLVIVFSVMIAMWGWLPTLFIIAGVVTMLVAWASI